MTAKIKLNAASGGGSFSLQAPSSSANNRVFTLPDSADATILTSTTATGKILQTKTTFVTARSSYVFSSASTYLTLTPLNTTITPIGANSKFIVSAQVSGEGTVSNQQYFLKLIRNVTSGFADGDNVNIATGDNSGYATGIVATSAFHGYNAENNDSTISTSHISPFEDSPSVSVGGNLQYKVQVFSQTTTTWYLNRTKTLYNESYGDYLPSWVTVMEVSA